MGMEDWITVVSAIGHHDESILSMYTNSIKCGILPLVQQGAEAARQCKNKERVTCPVQLF